ncbi:MAG: hypothetical protein GY798_00660 [Hyphomicrobiales bacterium]|nr:hypothetical protein [Hyphomicrobiales bacterium]
MIPVSCDLGYIFRLLCDAIEAFHFSETVVGHRKTDGHLGRNFLKGRLGDQVNAVMSAVGDYLRLILKWWRRILVKIIAAIYAGIITTSPQTGLLTADYRGLSLAVPDC